ncbi:hypothetical protein A3218_00745 [Pseudomonas chlororaphis]|nr:hypothetical protein A3218_00745 [Pseudomonas chlororaphis]
MIQQAIEATVLSQQWHIIQGGLSIKLINGLKRFPGNRGVIVINQLFGDRSDARILRCLQQFEAYQKTRSTVIMGDPGDFS